MLSKTHILLSLTLTSFALETTNPLALGAAAIASQLPDVDTSTSFVGRIFFPLSRWLEHRFPHRTVTHSVLATAMIAVVSLPLRWHSASLWSALVLGYFGGWFGDAFTKSGVAALYPLSSARLVIPANPRLRLSTGSRAEYIVLTGLLVAFLFSLHLNTNGGLLRRFNAWLAQPEGVVTLFARASSQHQILAHIEGRFVTSTTLVNAEFEVLEIEGEKLLVRDTNGLLYWAEQESACTHCHLAIHRVQARLGQPIVIETKELKWQEEEVGKVAGGWWSVAGSTEVVGGRWSVAGKTEVAGGRWSVAGQTASPVPPLNYQPSSTVTNQPTTNHQPPTTILITGELTLRDAEGLHVPTSFQHFNPVEVVGNTGEWTRYRTVRLRAATLRDLEPLRQSFGSGNLIIKLIHERSPQP